jgi:hypothetical protein
MFKAGARYSHDTGKDFDILVIKVRYVGHTYIKLLINWVAKSNGRIRVIPGGRVDGRDNITISKKDIKYWRICDR